MTIPSNFSTKEEILRAKLKIEVSREDIQRGIPKSACYCPIALALKRAFPNSHIKVTGTLFIDGRRFSLPAICNTFMGAFDTNKAVEPFEFELGE